MSALARFPIDSKQTGQAGQLRREENEESKVGGGDGTGSRVGCIAGAGAGGGEERAAETGAGTFGRNEIGKKLIAIAEDLPEDKYDYKPNPDSRTFRAVLIHVSASMYFFTDPAQKQKPRYTDDPKPADLKINNKADLVAYVKKCVQDGADVIKAKGDKGMSESVNAGGPTLIRISDLAYALNEHSGEHYGNLVVYYRNNGIVPPESRPKK